MLDEFLLAGEDAEEQSSEKVKYNNKEEPNAVEDAFNELLTSA